MVRKVIRECPWLTEKRQSVLHHAETAEGALNLLCTGHRAGGKDVDGNTPLHTVRSESVAAMLIAAGANPNEKNKFGAVPLIYAKDGVKVSVLLANGAKVVASTGTGVDKIHCVRSACEASAMLKFGADANMRSAGTGRTPLCFVSNLDVCKVLVEGGADFDAVDGTGMSVVMTICAKLGRGIKELDGEKERMIEYLVRRGANLDAVDQSGDGMEDVVKCGHEVFVNRMVQIGGLKMMCDVVNKKFMNGRASQWGDVITECLRLSADVRDMIFSFV